MTSLAWFSIGTAVGSIYATVVSTVLPLGASRGPLGVGMTARIVRNRRDRYHPILLRYRWELWTVPTLRPVEDDFSFPHEGEGVWGYASTQRQARREIRRARRELLRPPAATVATIVEMNDV